MGHRRTTEFIVRGALRDARGRVLLCRNIKGNYSYLPGGHVEFGEPAQVALAREFMEETGLRVRCGHLLATSENAFGYGESMTHEVNLVFHTELQDGGKAIEPSGLVASRERDLAFDWVSPIDLARMDVRPHGLSSWLAHADPLAKSTWLTEITAGPSL